LTAGAGCIRPRRTVSRHEGEDMFNMVTQFWDNAARFFKQA
jgi:hypothetical protein